MASSKFESLWKFMTNYNFEIEGDIPCDVICSLCGKLMIEPYAAECGCQFCGACIKDYLKIDVLKKCSGSNEGCCNDFLEIDINVFKDVRTNQNIKKVIVKCPNRQCSVVLELGKMENHIRSCTKNLVSCPFLTIGCKNDEITEDSIKDHFNVDIFSHSQFLIDIINKLCGDVSDLREKNESLEKKINEILKEHHKNEIKIEDQHQQIKELKEEGDKNKEEIAYVKDEISKKEILMNEMKKEICILKTKNVSLGSNCFKEDCNILKQDIQQNDAEIENGVKTIVGGITNVKIKEVENEDILVERESNCVTVNEEGTRMEQDEEIKDKIDIEIMALTRQLETLEQPNHQTHDCVWLINDFSKKINDVLLHSSVNNLLYSNPFYKDNYKFCLCGRITELMALKGNLYLELYLIIIKSGKDDIVPWPMRHLVEISVINQATAIKHKIGKYSFDTHKGDKHNFLKPTKEMNDPIGGLSIAVKNIKNVEGLLLKDTLMICCSLHPMGG